MGGTILPLFNPNPQLKSYSYVNLNTMKVTGPGTVWSGDTPRNVTSFFGRRSCRRADVVRARRYLQQGLQDGELLG